MSHADEQSPHRLFAAIVLMGTGMAVGCGGISENGRQVSVGGSSPRVSSAGSTGSGAATSTGGSTNMVMLPILGTSGTTTGPEPVVPGPFTCPPEQWSCASQECDRSHGGWMLPDACDCDPRRPLRPSDCEPGQVFVCQQAMSTSDGRPFTMPVALSCSCVEKAMYFCTTECDTAYGHRDLDCLGSEDELSALCGCAVIYLK